MKNLFKQTALAITTIALAAQSCMAPKINKTPVLSGDELDNAMCLLETFQEKNPDPRTIQFIAGARHSAYTKPCVQVNNKENILFSVNKDDSTLEIVVMERKMNDYRLYRYNMGNARKNTYAKNLILAGLNHK